MTIVATATEKGRRWFRVSDPRQDEESQFPSVNNWCADHSYETSDETTYTLHGTTAHKRNKKFDAMWQRVLDDFRSGKITVLVVWQMRRLDRKLEATQMIKQIVELGGRVEFTAASDQALNDLSTMGGRINLKLQEEIAYGESVAKAENVKLKMEAARKNNSATSGPCYGLRIECVGFPDPHNTKRCQHKKTFVRHPVEARVIVRAIDMYMTGKSLVDACRWLDAEGFKPRQSAMWQPKSLAKIFRNPALIGRTETGKRRGKLILTHEAVMDRGPWEDLQREMTKRAGDGVIIHRTNTAKLTNVVRCTCGLPMYRTSDNLRYRCVGRPTATESCRNSISLEWLDERIENALRHPSRGFGKVKFIKTTVIPARDHTAEIRKIEDTIRDLDQNMDDAEWNKAAAALRAQRQALIDAPDTKPTRRTEESKETILARWVTLDMDEKRGLLIELGITLTIRPALFRGEDPDARITLASSDPRIAAALARLMAA